MAGGCCGSSTGCSCLIRAGAGIEMSGSGTPADPYYVTAKVVDFGAALTVRDTDTVNMTLIGSGTDSDPFELRATSAMRVNDLLDVEDPSGVPAEGESLVYFGTFPNGRWQFATLPPAPAGSVNVASGIAGTGAVATPIRLATSGVWGQGALADLGADSTIGQPTYIDSEGNVRVKPLPNSSSPTWASITGKPTTFTPAAHTHVAADISAAEQLKINAGKINGAKITSTISSTTAPANPATGDLWFFQA
jgi:hypothetical protein